MSTPNKSGSSDVALDLDLHFLPAWAQRSSTENKYAKYEGSPEPRERRGDRFGGPGGPRRDRPPRRDGGPGRPGGAGPRGPEGGFNRPGGGRPFQHGGPRRDDRREERRETAPPPPLPVNVNLIPEEKGVEALARQIRLTGRAYPLFDIAHLVLKKPDRYDVQFSVIKDAEGKATVPLLLCDLDESLWLSEQEAMNHVLEKHFATFYASEKLPTDPPKGVYTFVAQCGMSGVILGPPNYHDYQNKLRKLHTERFDRMPFETFKSRVKIVKDEAVVKKWVEDQSFRTEYTCLNVPETLKLGSREEVEKHFRETHFTNVIKSIDKHTLGGAEVQSQPNRAIANFARRAWEDQTRFPLKVVNTLSQQFAGHGLHFFKVNKNVTHVSVARPRYLDLETTTVSDSIRKIVEFIQRTPNCTRRKIIEALAPAAAPTPALAAVAAAPASPAAPTGDVAGPAEAQAASAAASAPAPAESSVSPEVTAINGDLHWLVYQGHVIEFANSTLEMARKPLPKPPPAPKKQSAAPSGAASAPTEPSHTQVAAAGTVEAGSPAADGEQESHGSSERSGEDSMTSVPDSAEPTPLPAAVEAVAPPTLAESSASGEQPAQPS